MWSYTFRITNIINFYTFLGPRVLFLIDFITDYHLLKQENFMKQFIEVICNLVVEHHVIKCFHFYLSMLLLSALSIRRKCISGIFVVLFRIDEFGYELQKSGCNNPMTCTKTKQTNGQ